MKKVWVLMLTGIILFITATPALYAKMAYQPNAPIIKEFKGKLYLLPQDDWKHINSVSDLNGHQLKAKDWYKIIRTGNAKEANALLSALGQYLTPDELWPFVEAGLLRKNYSDARIGRQVADRAYDVWRRTVKSNRHSHPKITSNRDIKTHPIYRQNLTPNVTWHGLFEYPFHEPLTLEDAIVLLKSSALLDEKDYNAKKQRHQAINRIASHKNVEELLILMKDENFEVALGSWVALAKIMPEKVASEIVNHALWLQDEVTYTYGSGCVRNTAKLVPLVAALDLYADYLSPEQIKYVLNELPEMWTQNKFELLNVSHPNIKPVILEMKVKNPTFKHFNYYFEKWVTADEFKTMNKSKKPIRDMKQALSYVGSLGFDETLANYVIKALTDAKPHKEIKRFIYLALGNPNEHSFRFLSALLQSSHFEQNKEELFENFFTYNEIWPKHWQALKQQVISELKNEILDAEYVPITVQLALN